MQHLVFLHGLLGDQADWQKLIENLPHFHCVPLALPYHQANTPQITGFQDCCEYVATQIQQQIGNEPYWLVGYSLGGRLALYYAMQAQWRHNLQGLILEGANLGLTDDTARQQRWQADQQWAARFQQEPMEQVLADWYQQPVFADLSEEVRSIFIAKRQHHCGQHIAKMLLATSLAKQPDFRPHLANFPLPLYCVCGEKDQKFKQMAQQANLNVTLIREAGHNAHQSNPVEFAQKLTQLVMNSG